MANFIQRMLLKPLFDVLANSGIGLPHEGFETELMMAGKKPAMILPWPLTDSPSEKHSKLQPFVDSGDIIMIGTHVRKIESALICKPEHAEIVTKYATTERKFSEREKPSESEAREYHQFRRETLKAATVQEFCDRANDPQAAKKETDRLLRGEITSTVPIWVGEDFKMVPKDIREKIQSGELHTVTMQSYDSISAIISPKSSVGAGRELYARYWHKAEGYPALGEDDAINRIGHLLGYTEADTSLFARIQKQKTSELGLWDRLHVASYPLLRYARAQSLLMDDPTPL